MEINLKFSDEEKDDAFLAMNAVKMQLALMELSDLRREIYKGYMTQDEITVNGDKVLSREDIATQSREDFKKNVAYISEQTILDKLDEILDDIQFLIDDVY